MVDFTKLLLSVLMIDRAAPAIEFDGQWYDWGKVADTVDDVQRALASVGAGPDTRIGILLRNRPGPLAAALATLAHDLCMVSLNPLFPDDKLTDDLRQLDLPLIIGEAADLARPALAEMLSETGVGVIRLDGVLDGATLVAPPSGKSARPVAPGVIIEMLTSGTTGVPKRIALKRASFARSFASALSYESSRKAGEKPRLRSDITSLLINPITHIGGLWGALSCIAAGRKACLLERFTVSGWHEAVVRHRLKVAAAVPSSLRMILDADIPREDLSSLIALRTGTAPLDPAVVDEFWERYGVPVLQNYGATEFAGAVAGWTLKDFHKFRATKAESVGRFQPGVTGRIVDVDSGAEKPAGEEGILEMKAAQFGNGGEWLRTTDRAIIDADGFLFILGRSDNAIIRGGFKVHPDDVVAAIEKHPAIREAVVVAIPDRRLGELPAAAVMVRAGAAWPGEAELVAFLRQHLLPYQIPAVFKVVDDVPRTPSLKPALLQVRDMFVAEPEARDA